MARRYELIVFDWDGTLMDSTAMIAQSIQLACKDLGLPVPSKAQASQVIGLGLADALAQAVPDLDPAMVPQMVERYRHYYLTRDHQLSLFDGARELLVALKERGHVLAVATGKSRLGLDRALGVAGVGNFFDATRCADESFSKPHPGMLLELMEQAAVDPAATLMIGDTTHDLLMAANAGTDGVGVSYGAHDLESLRSVPSRAIVDSVDALQQWLLAHA